MSKKTWIMLKRGILDPRHRDRIGIRIWLYLHMLDRANWVEGAVLEWKDEAEADEMEMDLNTLRAQRRQLEADGYIKCDRRGHNQRVTILKWVNPREYSGKVYNPPDVASTPEVPSVENPALAETDRRSSDSQSSRSSSRSSGRSSGRSPQDASLDSKNHKSNVIEEDGGSSAAPIPSGFFRCFGCGALVHDDHRGTPVETDCRMHRGVRAPGAELAKEDTHG